MGSVSVDQIGPDGTLLADVDTTLSESRKNALLLHALPGATVEIYANERVIRFRDQIILKKQVTHLGNPWPGFKKRIQIPKSWLVVERQARADDLVPRFVGIYHYGEVTIFVDFDPRTYVGRKANNSAAHVSTNDLFQAQTLGQFSREDHNANRLTSIRADEFEAYLLAGYAADPRVEVFEQFNAEFLTGSELEALVAVKQMHAASWPDTFQGEWPGFYLEYRLDSYLDRESHTDLVQFQKEKKRGRFDYDLVLAWDGVLEFYGDLKSSDVTKHVSPGNDAEDLRRCVSEYGRFWYVLYEHETLHARDHGDVATVEWNEWRRSVGHQGAKDFNPLSYAGRFKQSVRYVSMKILELNEANFGLVLGDFNQGKQQDGAARAIKVMINKRNIDNFLIYSDKVEPDLAGGTSGPPPEARVGEADRDRLF
ncbi:hypothetical protein JNB_12893 [Janibacter sp. HTCC2649]|uniref:hypothetical protein n=1 Tax=Janibacter sp. HTCC2649 TaxID=313589 RepID=UPI000067192C|nr:hypothetical protein [Janibacter sp. HTCC2649]EAP97861.1 hypothetical protein JNB_12893 [Janibacter sp. HTCC2649]